MHRHMACCMCTIEVNFPYCGSVITVIYQLYTCRSITDIEICRRTDYSLCYVVKIDSTCSVIISTTYIENSTCYCQLCHWISCIRSSSCDQSCRICPSDSKCCVAYCSIFICIKFYTIAICTIYCMRSA